MLMPQPLFLVRSRSPKKRNGHASSTTVKQNKSQLPSGGAAWRKAPRRESLFRRLPRYQSKLRFVAQTPAIAERVSFLHADVLGVEEPQNSIRRQCHEDQGSSSARNGGSDALCRYTPLAYRRARTGAARPRRSVDQDRGGRSLSFRFVRHQRRPAPSVADGARTRGVGRRRATRRGCHRSSGRRSRRRRVRAELRTLCAVCRRAAGVVRTRRGGERCRDAALRRTASHTRRRAFGGRDGGAGSDRPRHGQAADRSRRPPAPQRREADVAPRQQDRRGRRGRGPRASRRKASTSSSSRSA